MDPISTIPGPVNAGAFVDNSSTASGAATLAEIVQLLNKMNEVISGLTVVAADLDAAEASVTTEAANRTAADADIAADVAVLLTGFSDHASLIQGLDSRVEELEFVTASGHVEESSGALLTMTNTTSHTINFTGTAGLQSLDLPTTMTDFSAGQHWEVVCNNADGVQISSSNWAHSSLTTGVANVNLLVGDIARVSVVDVAGTKKWSAAIMRGVGGTRAAAAGAGDLGAVDRDDRNIWINRTGDTGTRDLYLPELGLPTLYTNGEREITVILYGAPTSGTFVINCQGTDVFLDGATTFTMTEKSALRLIGSDASKRWAAIVGGAM